MVSYKGFNVNVASQIDAHPLPEFSTAQGLGPSSTVACYIPIYPGAQIWIEYSVDRPQPSEAIYLFKLFISSQFVTSWDCTSKYGFKGKTIYSLHSAKFPNSAGSTVGQCSLQYSNHDANVSPNTRDNCIEIQIHRVHARKRIRGIVDVPAPKSLLVSSDGVKLCDAGYIDAHQPARRYKYLLVDPQGEPYATCRFYCRSVNYLERHGILDMVSTSPSSMATSASQYFDIDTSPLKSPPESTIERAAPDPKPVSTQSSPSYSNTPEDLDHHIGRPYMPRSQSHSGSSIIKDSIEDLPSTVSRVLQTSPSYSPPTKRASLSSDQFLNLTPASVPDFISPAKASSPLLPSVEALRIRKRTSNALPSLDVNIPTHGAGQVREPIVADLQDAENPELPDSLRASSATSTRSISRPLSPFTSSGFLRRLISHGDLSSDNDGEEDPQARKGWRGQKRYMSHSGKLVEQRSHSKLGFFGRKAAA